MRLGQCVCTVAGDRWQQMGQYMITKKREAFTVRTLMALTTALADRNYGDAGVIAAALAKEYGVKIPEPAVR